MKIITASERLAERRGAKVLLLGRPAIGKTSQLRTLDIKRTLFIECEGGELAVQDLDIPMVRVRTFLQACDLAVKIGGPNPSLPPTDLFSQAHFDAVTADKDVPDLSGFETFFFDSITELGRLSYRHAEQQPEILSERTGRKDTRAAYGLHARQTLALLYQIQHALGANVILVGVLEKQTDDFGVTSWGLQMEGQRVSRELPAIVDEIITMEMIDFGDGKPAERAFVCGNNLWSYPAKDRSGRLEQLEPPHLGHLLEKLTKSGTARKPFVAVTNVPPVASPPLPSEQPGEPTK